MSVNPNRSRFRRWHQTGPGHYSYGFAHGAQVIGIVADVYRQRDGSWLWETIIDHPYANGWEPSRAYAQDAAYDLLTANRNCLRCGFPHSSRIHVWAGTEVADLRACMKCNAVMGISGEDLVMAEEFVDAVVSSPQKTAVIGMNGLRDLVAERIRQQKKWGEQNHPDISGEMIRHLAPGDAACRGYGIPTAESARNHCQESFANGDGNWADILIEEVSEAVEAGCESPEKLRQELVHVGAVVMAWIDAIDRRNSA